MSLIGLQKAARIKAVHAACRRLSIDDDTRRALQQRLTGKASLADMHSGELSTVLDHLNRQGGYRPRDPQSTRPLADDAPSKKIRALWLELHAAGAVRNPAEAALGAYVKRQTGVDALQWLSSREASAVIEALKRWLKRVRRSAA
ncbi:MAG: regulatory protein GemA [Desulfobulbus sp.]|nr:regulatory protein GemA [Desulfobulbus sp.]